MVWYFKPGTEITPPADFMGSGWISQHLVWLSEHEFPDRLIKSLIFKTFPIIVKPFLKFQNVAMRLEGLRLLTIISTNHNNGAAWGLVEGRDESWSNSEPILRRAHQISSGCWVKSLICATRERAPLFSRSQTHPLKSQHTSLVTASLIVAVD